MLSTKMNVFVLFLFMYLSLAKEVECNYMLRIKGDMTSPVMAYDFSNTSLLMMFCHCLENFSVTTCYAGYTVATINRVYHESVSTEGTYVNSGCFHCTSNDTINVIACHRTGADNTSLSPVSLAYSKLNSNCFGNPLPDDDSNICVICYVASETTTETTKYVQNTGVANRVTADSTTTAFHPTLLTYEPPTDSTFSLISINSQSMPSRSSALAVHTSTTEQSTPTTEITTDVTQLVIQSTLSTDVQKIDLTHTKKAVSTENTSSTFLDEHRHENISKENDPINNDEQNQHNTIKIIIGVIVAVVVIAIVILAVILYRRRKGNVIENEIHNNDNSTRNNTETHQLSNLEPEVYVDIFREFNGVPPFSSQRSTSGWNSDNTYGVLGDPREMSTIVTEASVERGTISSFSNLTYNIVTVKRTSLGLRDSTDLAEKPIDGRSDELVYSKVNKSNDANAKIVASERKNMSNDANAETLGSENRNLRRSQEHDYAKLGALLRNFENPYN